MLTKLITLRLSVPIKFREVPKYGVTMVCLGPPFQLVYAVVFAERDHSKEESY